MQKLLFILSLSLFPQLVHAAGFYEEYCNHRLFLKSYFTNDPTSTEGIECVKVLSNAGSTPEEVHEVDSAKMKIIGAGIYSDATQESLVFACVGAPYKTAETECDFIRPVYNNPQTEKSYTFGEVHKLYDIVQDPNFVITKAYFKRNLKAIMGPLYQIDPNGGGKHLSQFPRFVFKNVTKFYTIKTWNWSLDSHPVTHSLFMGVANDLNKHFLEDVDHYLSEDWVIPYMIYPFMMH